ncbi:hypothetical protein AB0M36_20390 [Actinoplanes sp. NPDC051346]|uniref:hypothetical protein n=1 Tax=Actinoplanes sp. NPDC051346 TaxID=3155048 RepID=UPI0034320353
MGAGNILIDDADVQWVDFASIPEDIDVPPPVDRQTLVTAGVAWEAATCLVPEPDYGWKSSTADQAER